MERQQKNLIMGVLAGVLFLAAAYMLFFRSDVNKPVEKDTVNTSNEIVERIEKAQEQNPVPEPPPTEPREKKKTIAPK